MGTPDGSATEPAGLPHPARPAQRRVMALGQRLIVMGALRPRALAVLVISLAAGMAVLVAAGAVFAKIAKDVIEKDGATLADATISRFFVDHRASWLTSVVKLLTGVGNPGVLLGLAVIAGALIAWRRRDLIPAALLLAAAGGCVALGTGIKLFVGRPRPPAAWWAVHETGFSFPSLHTLTCTATFGMLAYLAPRTWPLVARAGAWLIALLWALTIGFTRIYLAVHWPTDVAASFALGAAWLAVLLLAVILWRAMSPRPRADRPPHSSAEPTTGVSPQPSPRSRVARADPGS